MSTASSAAAVAAIAYLQYLYFSESGFRVVKRVCICAVAANEDNTSKTYDYSHELLLLRFDDRF
jgi:hypothetical protein